MWLQQTRETKIREGWHTTVARTEKLEKHENNYADIKREEHEMVTNGPVSKEFKDSFSA